MVTLCDIRILIALTWCTHTKCLSTCRFYKTMEYLKECVHVCRPDGHIVFDCVFDRTFSSLSVVEGWLAGPHRFPVVIPEKLLDEFARVNNLRVVHSFFVLIVSGSVNSFTCKKQ